MDIVYLPTESLKPYKRNAKMHPDWQIEQIKKSISTYGMNDPIAVWGKNNVVVEGHGRLMACKQLGIELVPVIRLDQLTDEQRKAYTHAHNKIAMETGLSFTALQQFLDESQSSLEQYGLEAFFSLPTC